MRALILALSLGLTSIAGSAFGHEFWIDPEKFVVSPGQPIRANIRTGEGFKGAASVYLPNRFRRFEIAQGSRSFPVSGIVGDSPAVNQPARDGLAVIIHETTSSTLTYEELAKFEKFVTHKDARFTLDVHREKGFPETDFTEIYSRYAKSLVAVGSGAGSDRAVGLETEIVALANPYTDNVSGGLPVRVFYQSAPRPNAQVEVFERAPGGAIRVFTTKTNQSGLAMVPVKRGHTYMLDAVVLREPAKGSVSAKVVWESLWANLTFAVPE